MRLSSFQIGSGPRATVLLHGFLGSGKNLRTVAQRWSEQDPSRTFLLPDLPGHGTSPHPPEDADLRALAATVIETARAEGLHGKLDIVGHSLGGRVALAGVLAAPEEVDDIVLLDISPSPISTEVSESGQVLNVLLRAPDDVADRREMRQALIDAGLSAPISDWLMMNVHAQDGRYRWRFDREGLKRLHARVNREDLWAALERPGAKVRCIRGDRSSYVSEADAERMRRAGCPVDTLKGAGHFVHVDALEPLLQLLAARTHP